MSDDDFVGVPRRRKRQSISFSTSRSEGTPSIADDNPDLDDQVMQRAQPPSPQLEDVHGVTVRSSAEDSPEFTPSSRLSEVNKRASQYEREYRLRLLHRLLMRNVPLDEVAKELGVSVSTVIRDRDLLYQRLREEATKLNINEIVGDSIGFYNEVTAMSLRIASLAKQPTPAKLAALRTALTAKADMHKFFQSSGVYDVLAYRAKAAGSEDDLNRLMQLTKRVLEASEDEEVDFDEDSGIDGDSDDVRLF